MSINPETKPEAGAHPKPKEGRPEDLADETSAQPAQTDFAAATKKIEELEARIKDQDSKYAYLYADFENFKKRAIKERSDLLKYGWESAARDLLQVVDNLERAIEHAPAGTDKALIQGLHMVLSQFSSTLDKQGIKAMETIGKPFDPNFEEAVAQEPSDQPAGTVTQQHSRGYTLHGRLLRPARVIISSGNGSGS